MLQQVLTAEVLPKLPVKALAALASTSRALRDLLYAPAALQAWRDAAAAHLPAHHQPSARQMDRAGIQQLLLRRATAVSNLNRGAGISVTAAEEKGSVRNLLLHLLNLS